MIKKTIGNTPAPKKDRIYGSKKNKPGSASSKDSSKQIVFGEEIEKTIQTALDKYNRVNPKNKITLNEAKAVVRRGMGAYSKSHRPTISGGAPNSRTAWGLARLYAFMRKKSGSKTANNSVKSRIIKKTYNQDNDLLSEGGKIQNNCNEAFFWL